MKCSLCIKIGGPQPTAVVDVRTYRCVQSMECYNIEYLSNKTIYTQYKLSLSDIFSHLNAWLHDVVDIECHDIYLLSIVFLDNSCIINIVSDKRSIPSYCERYKEDIIFLCMSYVIILIILGLQSDRI